MLRGAHADAKWHDSIFLLIREKWPGESPTFLASRNILFDQQGEAPTIIGNSRR